MLLFPNYNPMNNNTLNTLDASEQIFNSLCFILAEINPKNLIKSNIIKTTEWPKNQASQTNTVLLPNNMTNKVS